jgi:hypothetical protein
MRFTTHVRFNSHHIKNSQQKSLIIRRKRNRQQQACPWSASSSSPRQCTASAPQLGPHLSQSHASAPCQCTVHRVRRGRGAAPTEALSRRRPTAPHGASPGLLELAPHGASLRPPEHYQPTVPVGATPAGSPPARRARRIPTMSAPLHSPYVRLGGEKKMR